MEWRVEFPRLGAIDIIRAFHFQQKQSGIAFLGGNFGGNSNNQKIKMLLLQWIQLPIRCPLSHQLNRKRLSRRKAFPFQRTDFCLCR